MSEPREQHLDLDALADVLADVLAGGEQPEHLTSCSSCQARLTELGTAAAAVSASLAALEPPVMPAGLEDRLTTAVDGAHAPAPADVLPLRPRRSRWLPAAGAVAAAAAVVVGVVVLTNQGGSSPSTTTDRAAGPGYAVNDSGVDYTTSTLAAAVPGLLKGTAPEATTLRAPKSAAGANPVPTGATGGISALASDPLAALRDTAGLATCLASLTDPSQTGLPLALDYASYEGKPALVVVLQSEKADKVDVLVVPPGCSKADGSLLYFTRLPKP